MSPTLLFGLQRHDSSQQTLKKKGCIKAHFTQIKKVTKKEVFAELNIIQDMDPYT